MRRMVLAAMLAGLLVGCGSTTSPHASGLKTYTDPTFNFGFKYPSDWSVAGGKQETVGGVKTYLITVRIPNNVAQLQTTVDGQIIPFPAFEDGKVSADPSGGPDFFHYFHAKVSGYKAMHIERWNGKQMDEIDTIINTRTRAYDIRINTGTPPFSADVISGYNSIVRSMRLPFS